MADPRDCDLCGYHAEGPDTGPGNWKWRLGTHRSRAHGRKPTNPAARLDRLEKKFDQLLAHLGLEATEDE